MKKRTPEREIKNEGGLVMNVKIQSVKFDADKKLIDFINGKMAKLEKFAENAISAEVIMKVDKDHEDGNKVVTMKLAVPGGDLVADFRSKSFEESVDECIDALKKQIEKHKDRFNR
jgi:putative sigma-54 modulation protein